MMKNSNKKGFTLIELLVVIAIIGILSGTVIVSMSGTSEAAKDSRVRSTLGQIRTATEVYKFSQPGVNYAAGMWNDPAIVTLLGDLNIQGRGDHVKHINGTNTAWCVSQGLNSGTSDFHCVSNTGFNGPGTCTETTAVCTAP